MLAAPGIGYRTSCLGSERAAGRLHEHCVRFLRARLACSDVLEAIAGVETRLRKEIGGVETRLRKEIKTGADVQGAMAERLVLLERQVTGVDKQARPCQLLTSGATVAAAAAAGTTAAAAAVVAAAARAGLCCCGAAGPASALDSDAAVLGDASSAAATCMHVRGLPAGPLAPLFPRVSTRNHAPVSRLLRRRRPAACRWFDLPASKERLLKALLDKQHSAYHSLQGLVLQQMQVRSGGRRGRMLAGE